MLSPQYPTRSESNGRFFYVEWQQRGNGHTYECFESRVRVRNDGSVFFAICSCGNSCPRCAETSRELRASGVAWAR